MASLIRLKLFSMLMLYLLGTLNILATETASTFRHYDCTDKPKFSPKSSYQLNLNKLLSKLTSKVNTTNYYNTTVSGTNKQDTVYGLFTCNGYMEKCGECVNTSIQTLKSKCVFNKEAIIWTHECMVRYSNRFFYNTTEKKPSWCVKNSEDYEGELDIFNRMLSSLMEDLLTAATEAQMGSVKFAVKKITFSQDKHIFGFAQCMPYLSKENCRKCLRDAMNFLQTCARGKIGGRVIYPSCIVRYDHYLFFPLLRGGEEISAELNSLQFELSTIQEATNKFSDDNKIGEGGFGAVYKGVFSNGLEIAVKRLKKNSSQGATEFKKEVLLISKLQHRNLVRLIGFCVQRNEKILIYEFVHNKSLDYYLFSPQNHRKLSWSERYEIIRGIARGILYLHEDSHLNIIHCDLKPSNILLDNKMNAKISDFGLARIISIDQMQGNTSIISGTYGYMSPEYAMLGQFSMKSDVFSFGVIILEIISGKRNVDGNGKDLDDLLSHGNPDQRPIIAKIASYFSCDQVGKLPLPQEPAFFMRGKTETKDF
ncbi:hypothetical protein LR48_Vigan09g012000 [Vigna angularis]|uniref:Cysteine-rich receptor-like protein kinase n=1 Tax=Phaseolus angularis TaxID=3914 RepID=A0A0L9V8S4_PHAAN|nr:hypothetical protein LR48_Vigan09g012000 [Vigna angularis]